MFVTPWWLTRAMEVDALTEVLDRLTEEGAETFGDGESLVVLHRELARLEAVVAEATAAFDASGAWEADGAHTAAAWVATRCRLPGAVGRRQVRRGRALRHLPACREAWLEGAITSAHVDAVARLKRPATTEALCRDEELLVTQAKTLGFEAFTRSCAYWEQLADPDGVERSDEERRSRRDVSLEQSFCGTWLGTMTLDPISGTIVSNELVRLEQALFEADWKKAQDELGREPTTTELSRTHQQRRADALVEMATRSGTAPADGRRPAPLFSVYVGYETLSGRILELAQGMPLSPGALLPWLEEADIERAVFAPVARVEIGATTRLFSGATRRAIELRDRRCTHPFCDRPAIRCQVDHIVPYGAGGPTTQENGRLLCAFHNRLRNQRPPP